MGTAFHPELTADTRWHAYFVRMCEEAQKTGAGSAAAAAALAADEVAYFKPLPLPVS